MKKNNLVKFFLGPNTVYLVAGSQNIQAIFGSAHKIGNEELMLRTVLPKLYGLSKRELDIWAKDKSGRGKVPFPGTENQTGQRYWFNEHHIHTEYMSRTKYLESLSKEYYRLFSEIIDQKESVGKWSTVSLTDLCKNEMARCAVTTLVGPRIFELSPDFTDSMWEFDSVIFQLVLGLPPWLNPKPLKVRDGWNKKIREYLDSGLESFDWNGPDVESTWEPVFGARVCRELVKWLQESGMCNESVAGFLGTFLWA